MKRLGRAGGLGPALLEALGPARRETLATGLGTDLLSLQARRRELPAAASRGGGSEGSSCSKS